MSFFFSQTLRPLVHKIAVKQTNVIKHYTLQSLKTKDMLNVTILSEALFLGVQDA
jgi:hypothetical protein